MHTVNAGPRTAQAPVCQEVVLIGHHTWMSECVSVRGARNVHDSANRHSDHKLVLLTFILHFAHRGFGSSHLETDCFSAWTNASVIPGEESSFCASPLRRLEENLCFNRPSPNTKDVFLGKCRFDAAKGRHDQHRWDCGPGTSAAVCASLRGRCLTCESDSCQCLILVRACSNLPLCTLADFKKPLSSKSIAKITPTTKPTMSR